MLTQPETVQILKDAIDFADQSEHTGRALLVYATGLYPAGDTEVTEAEMYAWLVESNVYRLMIFHRDFASAVFGESPVCPVCGTESDIHAPIGCKNLQVQLVPRFQFHVREMIILDEPLEYLKEFVTKEKSE